MQKTLLVGENISGMKKKPQKKQEETTNRSGKARHNPQKGARKRPQPFSNVGEAQSKDKGQTTESVTEG